MSVLNWIWDGIKRLVSAVLGMGQSVVTWIFAAIFAVSQWFVDSINHLFKLAIQSFDWPELDLGGYGELFEQFAQVLALDKALASLGVCLSAWVMARLARLALVPIRALLELL